jgi:Tol biopolymer transport system component
LKKLSPVAIFILLSLLLLMVFSINIKTSFAQATFGEPIQLNGNQASSSNSGAFFNPCISGDGSKVAFISSVNGIKQVFVVDSDGLNVKQLTSISSSVTCLSINDDGSKVAFSTSMSSFLMENIFVVDTSGADQPKKLTNNINWAYYQFPSISGDGSKVAFVSNSNGLRNDVFVVNSDGTGLTQITSVFITPGAVGPSVSTNRDGSKMTFTFQSGARGVYVINSDGNHLTWLATVPYQGHWAPSISSDGSKVAFISSVNGIDQVFVSQSDGTQAIQITNNEPAGGDYPCISSDGSKIVFCSNVNGYNQIFVANSDGTGTVQVTANAAKHWAPAISHDGSKVIYCSETADGSDIFLVSQQQAPTFPCLEIKAESPVNILVIDEYGFKVGFDSSTQSIVNEIAGATYTGPGKEPQIITLPSSLAGTFFVQLCGTGTGGYTLTATTFDPNGASIGSHVWTGTINSEELWGTSFTVSSNGDITGGTLFTVPEYALGGLLALAACLAAFAAFKRY